MGVFLDENLSWKKHITYIENKIAKNIGLLYKAKLYLSKSALLTLYYAYIHSYISYANVAWGSTNITYLKKVNSLQKHAIRIVHNKNRYTHTKELYKENQILNVYQMNIFHNLLFMHKVKTQTLPNIFLPKFKKSSHSYPTASSKLNFVLPFHKSMKSQYRISIRGPKLWNNLLTKPEKEIENLLIFKSKIKSKLMEKDNETTFF